MVQVQANKKDRMLTITGERAAPEVAEEEKSMRRRRERRFGKFSRTFQVGPATVVATATCCCLPSPLVAQTTYSALPFSLLDDILTCEHFALWLDTSVLGAGRLVLQLVLSSSDIDAVTQSIVGDNQLPHCDLPWTCSFRRMRTWTASRPPSRTACSQ